MSPRDARPAIWAIGVLAALLTAVAMTKYPGRGVVFLFFSTIFYGLLLAGFRKKALFFDTFIGIFMWLGYWFKLSGTLLVRGGDFIDATGDFDYSQPAFDRVLLVGMVGASALLAASAVRERWWFSYPDTSAAEKPPEMLDVYARYRGRVLVAFTVFFVIVAATNLWLGIYQRGGVAQTVLPFGLNGAYAWLLLFGLTSISAVLLNYEFRSSSSPYLATSLCLLETFCSSLSMVSRGMIVNASTLMLGAWAGERRRIYIFDSRFKAVSIAALFGMFGCSVFVANFVRARSFRIDSEHVTAAQAASYAYREGAAVFINRWVGIEGAMAVSANRNLGWSQWKRAWQERAASTGTSFYDKEVAKSPFAAVDLSGHHFISMPGILAFCFYPGSYAVLFCLMFAFGILGSAIEIGIYKSCGANLLLCALMAQVIAYRYAHFGYAPRQSYLLVGTLAANVFLIFLGQRTMALFTKSGAGEGGRR